MSKGYGAMDEEEVDGSRDGSPPKNEPEFKQSLLTSLSAIAEVKVPAVRKVIYAVGTLPYAFTLNIIGFYFTVFLLDVALVEPLYVSAIVFAGRVWDAITDPAIGTLCLRTKTRLGRLRPWLLCAVAPGAAVFFFLWYIPDSGWSMVQKFVYYFILYMCFQTLLTSFHVPYTALIMHISNDFRQRDSVTFYRMSTDTFGILLGTVIYAVYIGVLSESESELCSNGKRVREGNHSGTQMAYWLGAATISVLYVTAGLTCGLFTREQKEQQKVDKKVSFFQGIKLTMNFRPYFYLVMMYMFGWVAISFLQANFSLYVIHALNMRGHFQYIIVGLLIAMLFSMQGWQRVIRRFGKKTCLFCGYMIYIPTIISFTVLPMIEEGESEREGWWKIALVYVMGIINGFGIGGMYLAAWSMLPDVIEESELHYGVRREELFYAYFVFFTKFGAGVTLGISNAILAVGQYDVEKCKQNSTTRLTLRMLMSVGPVLMMLTSLAFLHFYPITEARRKKTKLDLENMKKNNKKKDTVLIENTPVESLLVTTDEDEMGQFYTNGHTTEHTLDSGHYGSNAVLEDIEVTGTKL